MCICCFPLLYAECTVLDLGITGTQVGMDPRCTDRQFESSLPISNGLVCYSNATAMSEAVYICNDNFTLMGGATRVCQNDGNWNGSTPRCILGIVASWYYVSRYIRSWGGYKLHIGSNLPPKDNLRKEDKSSAPFIRRFHCKVNQIPYLLKVYYVSWTVYMLLYTIISHTTLGSHQSKTPLNLILVLCMRTDR